MQERRAQYPRELPEPPEARSLRWLDAIQHASAFVAVVCYVAALIILAVP